MRLYTKHGARQSIIRAPVRPGSELGAGRPAPAAGSDRHLPSELPVRGRPARPLAFPASLRLNLPRDQELAELLVGLANVVHRPVADLVLHLYHQGRRGAFLLQLLT